MRAFARISQISSQYSAGGIPEGAPSQEEGRAQPVPGPFPHSPTEHTQAHSAERGPLVTCGSGVSNLIFIAQCSLWNPKKDGESGKSGRRLAAALGSRMSLPPWGLLSSRSGWVGGAGQRQGGKAPGHEAFCSDRLDQRHLVAPSPLFWTAPWPWAVPGAALEGCVLPALNPPVSRRLSRLAGPRGWEGQSPAGQGAGRRPWQDKVPRGPHGPLPCPQSHQGTGQPGWLT